LREKRIQVTASNTRLPKVNKELIKDLLDGGKKGTGE